VLYRNLGNIHLPLSDKKQACLEIVRLSCQCSVLVGCGECNYFCIRTIVCCFTASLTHLRQSGLTHMSYCNGQRRFASGDHPVIIRVNPISQDTYRSGLKTSVPGCQHADVLRVLASATIACAPCSCARQHRGSEQRDSWDAPKLRQVQQRRRSGRLKQSFHSSRSVSKPCGLTGWSCTES
jgi:hypothetical protein